MRYRGSIKMLRATPIAIVRYKRYFEDWADGKMRKVKS